MSGFGWIPGIGILGRPIPGGRGWRNVPSMGLPVEWTCWGCCTLSNCCWTASLEFCPSAEFVINIFNSTVPVKFFNYIIIILILILDLMSVIIDLDSNFQKLVQFFWWAVVVAEDRAIVDWPRAADWRFLWAAVPDEIPVAVTCNSVPE